MRTFLTASVFLAAALSSGCSLVKSPSFAVNLVNQSLAPVHILPPGESFAPKNRLNSEENRFVNFPKSGAGEPKTFQVGLNGQVFQTVTCVSSSDTAPQNPNVEYTPTGELVCLGW